MNKALIAPLASILVILLKNYFPQLEVDQEQIEVTINTLLAIVAGIGIFMQPKKKDS